MSFIITYINIKNLIKKRKKIFAQKLKKKSE